MTVAERSARILSKSKGNSSASLCSLIRLLSNAIAGLVALCLVARRRAINHPVRSVSWLVLALSLTFQATASGQEAKAENFALIVGIDNYAGVAGVESLKHARRDAEALEKALRDRGYNVRVLRDQDARRSHIVSELTWLAVTTKPIDSAILITNTEKWHR